MDYNKINDDVSNTDRNKITTAVNFAYKTIDTLALYAREKSDSIIDMISKVSPTELCNFNVRNGIYMMRLMKLNQKEKEITLNALGIDAVTNGNSHSITNTALSPSYAEGMNYKDEFAIETQKNELDGHEATFSTTLRGNSNLKTTNLYHDDNSTGEEEFTNEDKIKTSNLNSILYKTKKLFNQHKINTIISRFHTDPTTPTDSNDTLTSYGLSHGRNLLTGKAERKGGTYNRNGYDNPYCRVWTHHYQYDRLNKRIRPFNSEDGKYITPEEFHKWLSFKNDKQVVVNGKEQKEWGWKDNTDGWKKSVLGENGFINIVPKFQGGGSSNIHTKQCMFSIENLAWRDYDPYSFEKALSWEQRGPMGGRIMWFPPYGISFNETTSTNWSNNTFIGRGEDVYTYINTIRSGTLNFMMVVDHPSIIDYVSWGGKNQDGNKKVSDNDIHRFFAGCDDVAGPDGSNSNGGVLSEYATPTPLTDEYVEVVEKEIKKAEKKVIPPEPEIPDTPPIEITFYVFYPNNYSGYYDEPNNEKTKVEAIPYLLYGKGAQMKPNNSGTTDSLPLNFNEIIEDSIGRGYEMEKGGNGIGKVDNNYVIGTEKRWWNGNIGNKYVPSRNRLWWHRIDGEYKNEKITSLKQLKGTPNAFINCYDQNLPRKDSYVDSKSLGLNSDVETVKSAFTEEKDNENLYTLAEIAYLFANDNIKNIIKDNSLNVNLQERTEELDEKLNKNGYELNSVIISGYSNEHGKTITDGLRKERNKTLAKNRSNTVKKWLEDVKPEWSGKITVGENIPSHEVDTKDKTNESGDSAKKWRSAKVVMLFTCEKSENLSDTNQKPSTEENPSEFVGFSKHYDDVKKIWYYKNENETRPDFKDKRWFYNEKENQFELEYVDGVYNRALNVSGYIPDLSKYNIVENNKIRYDQEYHFFRALKEKDRMTYEKLMEKIQYFNPAYHSMTPEGFNARLTFLNQCMRQGNTVSASDRGAKSANNLAFGRPPYCVLRLGDFYNQMIVIDNISINYDPLVWDLNEEGIGVMPLIANISMSFKFIGGGDLGGPVRRLQNAMSFNYYANARLYDNRADRMEYNWDDKTNGAIDHDLDFDNSYFYTTQNKREI